MEDKWAISPREYCFSAHDLQKRKERMSRRKTMNFEDVLQANDRFLTVYRDDFTRKCIAENEEDEK